MFKIRQKKSKILYNIKKSLGKEGQKTKSFGLFPSRKEKRSFSFRQQT